MKLSLFIILSFIMIATRFPFGGDFWHVFDASWALFFVLGRLAWPARQMLAGFIGLSLLGWGIDLLAVDNALVGNFCMTPAYLGMPLAYLALTGTGYWSARGAQTFARLIPFTATAAVAAFVITNLFFYSASGYFDHMVWSDYAAAVVKYLPNYYMTMQVYVLAWWLLNQYKPMEHTAGRDSSHHLGDR